MYFIEDVFKILKFLENNPDSVITQNYLSQSTVYIDKLLALNNSLTLSADSLEANDQLTIQTSLNGRNNASSYFNSVLKQVPFNTYDYNKLLLFLIDWYSANRTILNLTAQANDPFTLTSEDLDLAIAGFGAEIFNEKIIRDKKVRAILLTSLCNLYKIKGSAASILRALQFIGFSNLTLREWWVARNPKDKNDLQLEGKVVSKGQYFDEVRGQWKLVDENVNTTETLTWKSFELRLAEIGEPHWMYKREEILSVDNDPNTKMKLPSITPYYSIIFNSNVEKINQILSVLERMISLEFCKYLFNTPYMYTTTIENYGDVVSILELWLAFNYAEVRAEEEIKYKHLTMFLHSKDIKYKEFNYPNSYEQLILWCSNTNNVPDYIIETYVPTVQVYYGAGNELIRWWNSETYRVGTPIPEIFYTVFKYPRTTIDVTKNSILCYNGNDTVEATTELDVTKILDNYDTLANKTPFVRTQIPNTDVVQPELLNVLQKDYSDLAYHETFHTIPLQYDTTSHDGSDLLPDSNGTKDDWKVDDQFYYKCISTNIWWRIPIELSWSSNVVLPTYPELNETVFYQGYLYRYVSKDKWIRYQAVPNLSPFSGATNTPGEEVYNISTTAIQYCVATDNYVHSFFSDTWTDTPIRINIYYFPVFDKNIILDLSDRYSADKVMRGTHALAKADYLDNITPTIGMKVLVCGTTSTPPIVYEYQTLTDGYGHSFNAWISTDIPFNTINLGVNSQLLNWVDEQTQLVQVTTELESEYTKVSEILIDSISAFINTNFRTTDIDFSGYFTKFNKSDDFMKVIEFFKPYRARMLFYALSVMFDDRLENTLATSEEIGITRLDQVIESFVPRHDTIFIHKETGLFNRIYSTDNPTVAYEEGIFNHWNEHHPRDPNIRASVTPEYAGSSPKEWQIGFCRNDPRIIFPPGILGYPETVTGDRLEYYDAYLNIPGQQVGPMNNPLTVSIVGLNKEEDLIVKGGATPVSIEQVQTKEGISIISVVDNGIEKPVHHRPVFIAIQEHTSECYPAKKNSCCDYFDTGCRFDGPTNPHLDRWDGTKWVPLPESLPHLDPGERNNGDTYCTPCGSELFTPDPSSINIPEKYIHSGVFHNSIIARGFESPYDWINGEWTKCKIVTKYNDNDEDQFVYGYNNLINDKLVHFRNKKTDYHYWKLIDSSNNILLKTELKNKIHEQIEEAGFLKQTPDYLIIEKNNYLNGNDVDLAGDSWNLLDGQTVIPGNFSNLKWVRFATQVDWASSSINIYPNSHGKVNQLEFDGTNLYQCISDNTWVRTQVETNWTDDSFVYPDSPKNYFQIIYRNSFLYVYVEIYSKYRQWVRIGCEESWDARFTIVVPDTQLQPSPLPPTQILPMNSSIFQFGATAYVYKTVNDYSGFSEEYCSVVVPFNETYRGIWEQYKFPGEIWCEKYSIWDEISPPIETVTFRDAVRRVPEWIYNTWQAFEPGYAQEATWQDLVDEGTTWADLEGSRYYQLPPLSELDWNGIRSNVFTTYQQYYNILSLRINMYNWPHFNGPFLNRESDIDYWNSYDKLELTGIVQRINDSRVPLNDDLSISVYDYGEPTPIDPSLWSYLPKEYMIHENSDDKVTEDDKRRLLEFGNQIVPPI